MPEGRQSENKKALLAELEQLREENARLRGEIEDGKQFLEVTGLMSSEMFWRSDEFHRFTYMSPAVVETVDQPMLDQLGKTRAELSSEDLSSPKWQNHLADLEAHRPFKDFRYTRRHTNGELREISASGRPVFDEKGVFHGYIGVASDITRQLRAEAKAKSAEDVMMAAINALDCIFTIWDADDRLVLFNEQFKLRNSEIPDHTFIGVTFEEHIRALVENGILGDTNNPERWITERMRRHQNPSGAFEISQSDGTSILINEAQLADGGIITMATDITAQKRVEQALLENRQRLLDFSSTAADWFWEMNAELKYTYVSVDNTRLTGMSVAEQIGRTFRETQPRRLSEAKLEAFEETLENREDFKDVRYSRVTEDGREIFLAISGKPYFDDTGAFVGYRGGGRNIDKLVETEEALRREKERAERASRAKSEFLAHMSHELRTPLNAILGFSEIISEQLFGPVGNASYIEYAENIHHSGEHLLSLINDLLDLSKIEAGKFELVPEDLLLRDIVNQSERLFSHRLSQRHIRFDVQIADDATHLHADQRAMSQILFNILSNAEKYNRDGGAIIVMIYRTDDGGTCIAIKDTGCGFRIDDTHTALAPFGRIENPLTKEAPGTGLGLPIVSALMDLHDGKLEITSEIDKGTEVRLYFPPRLAPE